MTHCRRRPGLNDLHQRRPLRTWNKSVRDRLRPTDLSSLLPERGLVLRLRIPRVATPPDAGAEPPTRRSSIVDGDPRPTLVWSTLITTNNHSLRPARVPSTRTTQSTQISQYAEQRRSTTCVISVVVDALTTVLQCSVLAMTDLDPAYSGARSTPAASNPCPLSMILSHLRYLEDMYSRSNATCWLLSTMVTGFYSW